MEVWWAFLVIRQGLYDFLGIIPPQRPTDSDAQVSISSADSTLWWPQAAAGDIPIMDVWPLLMLGRAILSATLGGGHVLSCQAIVRSLPCVDGLEDMQGVTKTS
jgi:hypothetical protein